LLALLRDYRQLGAPALEAVDRVSRSTLGKKLVVSLNLNRPFAKADAGKKSGGIYSIAARRHNLLLERFATPAVLISLDKEEDITLALKY
jgi:hypothetical protein